MLGGTGSPGGDELLTVTVVRDDQGYGMKVSGDNPVYVQSVKEHGAAWRAGLRAGDRILRVDGVPVHHHTHQQVVHMIRANTTAVLTVHQARHKTPITAPLPVNPEKQRQLEVSKVHTVRLMLEQEQKYIRDLRSELSKVPDVRKQAQLESSEQRCSILQHEIDTIMAGQPADLAVSAPMTPRLSRTKTNLDKPNTGSPPPNSTSFLSGLPRSLSNLTGQSLRNLRTRQNNNKIQQENTPPLVRQNSDESNSKRRHGHNNTVPLVPTTCLDNVTPPPLPPRSSIERPKRNPLSPTMSPGPVNPLAKPKPCSSSSPIHKQYYKGRYDHKNSPMHQSMPAYRDDREKQMRMSSHSLDSELDGPQPNSIAMQMSYPLVNVPPPPLQTDNRGSVSVLHTRSQSSPEHLDHGLSRPVGSEKEAWERGTPPPGTPPPPYAHNTQPCADPQRAIISMEEDDSPASDNLSPGLYSSLRAVMDSNARMAVLLKWLLEERRCAGALLFLLITDGYRSAQGVTTTTLRRWAYEIQSTFLMPNAVLMPPCIDLQAVNEVENVLQYDYNKEEILRNVFRKARLKAKEEMSQQLNDFQGKRQVGLGSLYAPDDALIEKCIVDKAQEQVIVESLLKQCISGVTSGANGCGAKPEVRSTLLAALQAAALCLQCRPATVAAAVGGARASFLQRDKLYKQRVKQMTKQQNLQPFEVRGHHLQLQALTSVGHCHQCENVIWGLAPQAYICANCKLRVHPHCAKIVEEPCCIDGSNRKSRFMDLIHSHPGGPDSVEKKSRKTSSNFLNMERNVRKLEDEQPWDQTLTPQSAQGESKREGSSEEPTAPDEADTNDAGADDTKIKDSNWRSATSSSRGVNRAESCRERDAPRRGKHRNASDPNRFTPHNHHDLEPGAATAPSGSSSSSSLSSRSNESNTVPADQQASQSDWSEEEDRLAAQWTDSVPAHARDALSLSARLRKRQEVIHELIVSEGSHVRWLKVLSVDFLRPLERQPSLLPADELRALFPNLPGVRERHVKLYADLRALRNDSTNHIVGIRGVADAILNTLGDAGYSSSLSRFCRGQRMALESLRERRRKNKELHQFLSAKEQLPRCERLQLRDLLACVWQRLTKYQLLLEGILKTINESDADTDEDIARLKKAHETAKDVLQNVDTAIRTAENDHRLKIIQNKLEVRAGSDWGEDLRRLDLTQHSLRMEGELNIRHDGNKKISVLALMLTDVLVLLQREGDKFVLKPIPAPSQQTTLSPLVIWDKVLFRPNAAVRNTFFLMNINGVQMHELSANTAAEYTTWVKNIQECPLAKLAEQKPTLTPSHHHQASRSTDDSGINVSRNPSDASEKSTSTAPADDCERENSSEREDKEKEDREKEEKEKEEKEKEEKDREDREKEKHEVVEREDHKPRRPTVSRISTHSAPPPLALEPQAAVTVNPPIAEMAHVAHRAFTQQEQLRRLDEAINRALRAKSVVVAELLGVPVDSYAQVADLAVTEALGQCDTSGELRLQRSISSEEPSQIHTLLLAALTQANQLTESLSKALSVNEAAAVAARARGRCDNCSRRPLQRTSTVKSTKEQAPDTIAPQFEPVDSELEDTRMSESFSVLETIAAVERDVSFDMLTELQGERESAEDALESNASAATLAASLVPLSGGLQRTLAQLLAAVPALEASRRQLRRELPALRDANDALRAQYQMTDEISYPADSVDQSLQDQPSNGG